MSQDAWPRAVKSGSFTVRVYRTERSNGYTFYTVTYSLKGERHRKNFSAEQEALDEAQKVADRLGRGEQLGVRLRPEDTVHYAEALRHVAIYGVPLSTATQEWAESRKLLGGLASVPEAAREYARRHATITERLTVPQAVERMIAQEASTHRKAAWVKLLTVHVQGKFAQAFQTAVTAVDSKSITDWLTQLPGSERTKKNVRDCVSHFLRWCRGQGYLPKDADPMDGVPDFRKRRVGAVSILSPDELRRLLDAAPGDMVPYLALRAFAGLRDSEASKIQWQDIDLASEADEDGQWGWVTVSSDIAKQTDKDDGTRRLVPVCLALHKWLSPHAKRHGPVSPYANMQKKARAVAGLARVVWKRNCLRHSYISYAIARSGDVARVATESGNSPQIIRSNYLRVVRPERATKWFAVLPPESQELPPDKPPQGERQCPADGTGQSPAAPSQS